MRESIHKYFKVGTIQWMSYPKRDAMESLKAICKDDFFDAIELKGYGEKNAEAKALLAQDPNLAQPQHKALSDEVARLFATAGAMN